MMDDEIQTCKTWSKYIQSHQVVIPVPFASFCSKSFGLTFSRVHSHWKTTADLFNAQHFIQFACTKRSFTSAHVLCSSFNGSFLSSQMTCWVCTLMVKVPPTLSKELPAGLGLRTANQNSNKMFWLIVEYFSPFASSWDSCWSANTETKAITEMIAITSKSNNALPFGGKSNKSFDNKSSSIFQLVDASVDWISNVISAHAKCPSSHESSCTSQLVVRFKYLKSHKTSCVFPLATRAKCLRSQALCIAFGMLACPSVAPIQQALHLLFSSWLMIWFLKEHNSIQISINPAI